MPIMIAANPTSAHGETRLFSWPAVVVPSAVAVAESRVLGLPTKDLIHAGNSRLHLTHAGRTGHGEEGGAYQVAIGAPESVMPASRPPVIGPTCLACPA